MKEVELKINERIDDLHRNGYRIIQNSEFFCFGMDAVLLTGFAKVKKNETVLDLGTGTGVIPLLLAAKTEGKHFYGLEIQAESADMARRSVKLNECNQRVEIVVGDIKEACQLFPLGSFDVITSNPPYMPYQSGLKNDNEQRSIARHEMLCSLEDVIQNATKLLKVGGRFYMVHRPHRLVDILSLMRQYGCEPKRMRLVQPYLDKEPNMVLIEGVRKGKVELKIERPLVIYTSPNIYTDEVMKLYND